MVIPEDADKAAADWQEMMEHAQDYATNLVLPAAAASVLVMLLVRLIGGRRAGPLASLLAMAAGAFMGGAAYEVVTLPSAVESKVQPYLKNAISDSRPWQLEKGRAFDVNEVGQVLAWSLEEKPPLAAGAEPPQDPPPMPKYRARYWIAYLAGLAMLLEFFLPLLLSAGPGWAVRMMLALLAGRLLTRGELRTAYPWLPWAMGFVILLQWGLLVSLSARWRDGVLPTAMTFCLFLAGGVLMLSALLETGAYAVLFGACLVGPALVSWILRSDSGPALAACSVILPGLLLEGLFYFPGREGPGLEEDVLEFLNFQLLAALAPLALLPMWLPSLARLEGWRRWLLGLSLPLIPAVIAAVWAYLQSLPAV